VNIKNEYNDLVQAVIDRNFDLAIDKNEFCNSRLGEYKVIENDVVKIIFSPNDQSCDVRRKENDNPVFCRDGFGTVYRIHGEFGRVKENLIELANR
jgi:hypothetical protein